MQSRAIERARLDQLEVEWAEKEKQLQFVVRALGMRCHLRSFQRRAFVFKLLRTLHLASCAVVSEQCSPHMVDHWRSLPCMCCSATARSERTPCLQQKRNSKQAVLDAKTDKNRAKRQRRKVCPAPALLLAAASVPFAEPQCIACPAA